MAAFGLPPVGSCANAPCAVGRILLVPPLGTSRPETQDCGPWQNAPSPSTRRFAFCRRSFVPVAPVIGFRSGWSLPTGLCFDLRTVFDLVTNWLAAPSPVPITVIHAAHDSPCSSPSAIRPGWPFGNAALAYGFALPDCGVAGSPLRPHVRSGARPPAFHRRRTPVPPRSPLPTTGFTTPRQLVRRLLGTRRTSPA